METRLSGGDVALEPQNDDGEESYAPIAYLADDSSEPTRVLEAQQPRLAGRRRHRAARSTRSTRAAAASSRSAGSRSTTTARAA